LLNMLIQVAVKNDAEEILQLQKIAYQSEAAIYNDYTIPPLTQSLAEMISDIHKQTVLKAVVDGKIIGSVRGYIEEGTGYIGRLIGHPEFQGQGIGTRLVQAIEEHLNQAKRYELFTGHKSERNIRLYQKLGYQISRSEPASDGLIMVYMEKVTGDNLS
jgi:ribosomal protein S18 acetylase RimI-like enzyme